MITESLDISSRPIKEVMVPRPQVKAIEISASPEQIKEIMLVARYSRYPVYRGRLDNIEGILHVKDILPPLIENGDFRTAEFLHKPLFIPESASLEKAILQMQENRTHLALVVDEFGNMEGIVTLADIIEEIVGKIHESYREKEEDWHSPAGPNSYLIKGAASIKDINRELPFKIPEKANYTTLAGFFLDEYGKIPKEKDSVSCEGIRLIVEKMNKRHISLIRVLLTPKEDQNL
jgi:putative hemolysin